jgi:hypothetical protein
MRTENRLISVAIITYLLIGCTSIEPVTPPQEAIAPVPEVVKHEQTSPELIEWRVTNPFRLFKDQKDLDEFVANEEELKTSTPIQAAEERLANTIRNKRSFVTPYKDTEYNRERMTYNPKYVYPETHNIEVRLPAQYADKTCIWSVDNSDQLPSKPCAEWKEIDIKASKGGSEVSVKFSGIDQPISTKVELRDLLIVGLGDSFASGEGNPDKSAVFGTNRRHQLNEKAEWLDQVCHRSLYSQQARAAMQLAKRDPHTSVTFLSFACSGAKINEGIRGKFKGPEIPDNAELDNWDRSQIDALKNTLGINANEEPKRRIDFMLLSIGGNDVGFAKVIIDITIPKALKKLSESITQPFKKIKILKPAQANKKIHEILESDNAYNSLLKQLHDTFGVNKKNILVTLYPNILKDESGESFCGSEKKHKAGLATISKFSKITLEESQEAYNLVLDPLNKAIQNQINNAIQKHLKLSDWTLVDEHVDQFKGHGWCATRSLGGQDALAMADDPNDFLPYANRTRWVRTPNDAFSTTSLRHKKIERIHVDQLPLANKLIETLGNNGAFHPTAMGHAVIADGVYKKMTELLDSPGQ